MIDEECHLLDDIYNRLSRGEDVWKNRDARSTAVDLMVWFNGKATTFEGFPFAEWFPVIENISERLGSGQPVSPEINQKSVVAIFQTKPFEVRMALLNYISNRFSQGLQISEEVYETLLGQFSKLIVKLVEQITLRHPTYIPKQLCLHANCNYFSEELLQRLNKARDQEFIDCMNLINKIYEKVDEFFYTNDLRVLMDILIRNLEDPPSEEAAELCLKCMLLLSCSTSFPALRDYRKQSCLQIVKQVAELLPQLAQRCEELKQAYEPKN